MKSLLRKTVPAVLLISLMSSPVLAENGIGTVDFLKVFNHYWRTKQADAALEDRRADLEKDQKTLLEAWQKAKDEYQTLIKDANNETLSVQEREKRRKAAEDKFKQIKDSEDAITQHERQARADIDERRKRMRDRIVEEIRTAVNGKARAAGYTLVFDSSAESANNHVPVLLYTSNENDITDSVLAQLNAAAPAEPPKSKATTSEKNYEPKKTKE